VGVTRGVTALILALLAFPGTARADPTKQECVEANEKGQDLRQTGKLRAAREQLALCVAATCPGPVREDCGQRLSEVAAAQPRIVFAAKDAAGNDLEAVRVTMDGVTFTEKLDGTALDVDPGEHVFRFETAAGVSTEKKIVVREGEKRRRESVTLGADGVSGPRLPALEGGSSNGWVYAAFGVGGVGLVVGTVFGVLALGTRSSLDSECGPSKTGCPQNDVSRLNTQAWGADIGLGMGVVGAVVGTVLLLTSPGSPTHGGPGNSAGIAPWIGVGSAGVVGRFR
jgi:hypothetical protein